MAQRGARPFCTISQSTELWDCLSAQGVRFQPSLGGALSLGRTNAFFLGGGRSMLNALYRTAERLGVEVRYDAEVTGLDIDDGFFAGAPDQVCETITFAPIGSQR